MKKKVILLLFLLLISIKVLHGYTLNNGQFYSSSDILISNGYKLIGSVTQYGAEVGVLESDNYRLTNFPFLGCIDVDEYPGLIPTKYVLFQNYPNPFNPNTTIWFGIRKNGNVLLQIYNLKGQLVKTLVSNEMKAGYHFKTWDGKDENGQSVSSGIYLYKFTSGNTSITKRMVLIR